MIIRGRDRVTQTDRDREGKRKSNSTPNSFGRRRPPPLYNFHTRNLRWPDDSWWHLNSVKVSLSDLEHASKSGGWAAANEWCFGGMAPWVCRAIRICHCSPQNAKRGSTDPWIAGTMQLAGGIPRVRRCANLLIRGLRYCKILVYLWLSGSARQSDGDSYWAIKLYSSQKYFTNP